MRIVRIIENEAQVILTLDLDNYREANKNKGNLLFMASSEKVQTVKQ